MRASSSESVLFSWKALWICEIGPKYAERNGNGGYTRIIKIGPRRGDAFRCGWGRERTQGFQYQNPTGNVTGINRALDGIDIEVKAGDFIAVLGANGSGKSTFAKYCNALFFI